MKIRDLFAGAGGEPVHRVPENTIRIDTALVGRGGGGGAGKPLTIRPADVERLRLVFQEHTAKARLVAAQEDALAVMARVHPTPTYDAVCADLGYDPHMSIR